VSAEEKIARALGLLLVRNMEQKTEQVTLLRSIGFEVSDVAAMLGMTENHVNVAAFHGRKKTGKKSA
jgi:DNA-directed RNA polymerase specialized sigma24 family protein